MWTLISTILALPSILWLILYFVPILLTKILPAQNLKKKYEAEWALVTGGSSGIGKSLVIALAEQGFNVLIVALGGELLDSTHSYMEEKYSAQKFIKVGVNFSPGQDYMTAIGDATKDIDVQCIFNNAGYVVTGFFESSPKAKQESNLECNAVAAVKITHHFLSKMLEKKLKGCIVFTSSAVAYLPSPFAAMYGATKGFITNLAGSLASEVRCKRIDILAIHPSPVATNFYTGLDHKISLMEKASQGAMQPSMLPDVIFRSLGRVVWRDIGSFAIAMRVVTSVIPGSFMAWVAAVFAPYLPDYKNHDKARGIFK
mmetsp:Transcript_2375/g.3188  ORF Transcript_2375/g.3188 Transcript_2375/m.3188 type:complete len:314 (-) Transcript_2375:24-965(-)